MVGWHWHWLHRLGTPSLNAIRSTEISVKLMSPENICRTNKSSVGPWWWSSGQCVRLLSDEPSSNPAEAHNFSVKFEFEKRRTLIDRISDWQNGDSVNLHWKNFTSDWQKVTSPEKFGQTSLRGSSWPKLRSPNGAPAYWQKKVPN